MSFSFQSIASALARKSRAAWSDTRWRETLGEQLELDGDLIRLNDEILAHARGYNVVPSLHYKDFIFYFLYNLCDKDFSKAAWTYYMSGRTSADTIKTLLAICYRDQVHEEQMTRPLRMLDFASGYGCAARHIGNVFPNATVDTCDIHEDACTFNRDVLGLPSIRSSLKPEDLAISGQYDVVFALSFLTHIGDDRFLPWLRKLASFVAPGGFLIFTTHGEETHRTQAPHFKVGRNGYGSAKGSEQLDLSRDDYINVITYPKYVLDKIAAVPDVEHTAYWRALWWLHQDAYILRKLG